MDNVYLNGRTAYSLNDSKEVFLFAYCNRDQKLMGYRVWKKAEELRITSHSWSSMHNHYKKTIKPQFIKYYSQYENEAVTRMAQRRRHDNISNTEESTTNPIIGPSSYSTNFETNHQFPFKAENVPSHLHTNKNHRLSQVGSDPIEEVEDGEFFENANSKENKQQKNPNFHSQVKILENIYTKSTYHKQTNNARKHANLTINRMRFTTQNKAKRFTFYCNNQLNKHISAQKQMNNHKKLLLASVSNKLAELDISLLHWLMQVNLRYNISLNQAFESLIKANGYEVLAMEHIQSYQ